MIDQPTNKQLANFLIVYAKHIPGLEGLQLKEPILEYLLGADPGYRDLALKHHNHFADEIVNLAERMKEGKLQCAHIRHNGKACPNFNEPGSAYCGLHRDKEVVFG